MWYVVHNFVLCFYMKALFFGTLAEFPLGENCLVDVWTACILALVWGLCKNEGIFSKTCVQYKSYSMLLPKSHVWELRFYT